MFVAWKADPTEDAEGISGERTTTRGKEEIESIKEEVMATRKLLEGSGSGVLKDRQGEYKTNFRLQDKARYTFANRGLPKAGYTGFKPQRFEPAARDTHLPDILHAIPKYMGHRPGSGNGTLWLGM